MRLIDGEKFAAVLQDLADKHAEGGKTDVAEILLSVKGMLERQETVDAVPVTRCKDCDWCEPYGDYFFCEKIAAVCTLEDYCSFREKLLN